MSVGDLFLGALVPGMLLGGLYIVYLLGVGWLKPGHAPAARVEPMDLPAAWRLLLAIVPAGLLIVAVLGSIFFGLATPTEAAGVGAAGALVLALVKRSLNRKVMIEVVDETSRTTAFIFAAILGAVCFTLVLRGLGGDELIAGALLGLPFGPTGIIVSILIATFLLGFFLDWLELTLIILPLVSPVVAALEFDPVWFTVMFAVCLQTSFLTPAGGRRAFLPARHRSGGRGLAGDLPRRRAVHRAPAHWHWPSSSTGKRWPLGCRRRPTGSESRSTAKFLRVCRVVHTVPVPPPALEALQPGGGMAGLRRRELVVRQQRVRVGVVSAQHSQVLEIQHQIRPGV